MKKKTENSHFEPKNGGLEDDVPVQFGESKGNNALLRDSYYSNHHDPTLFPG